MRRPRDWGHPCPHAECSLFKLMNRGHVSAISTSMTESGKRRICRCRPCETTFSETQDTVFFDLRTSEEKGLMALKMLLVRVDLSGISFVLGVHEETVLAWLVRAAAKAHGDQRAFAAEPARHPGPTRRDVELHRAQARA